MQRPRLLGAIEDIEDPFTSEKEGAIHDRQGRTFSKLAVGILLPSIVWIMESLKSRLDIEAIHY